MFSSRATNDKSTSSNGRLRYGQDGRESKDHLQLAPISAPVSVSVSLTRLSCCSCRPGDLIPQVARKLLSAAQPTSIKISRKSWRILERATFSARKSHCLCQRHSSVDTITIETAPRTHYHDGGSMADLTIPLPTQAGSSHSARMGGITICPVCITHWLLRSGTNSIAPSGSVGLKRIASRP